MLQRKLILILATVISVYAEHKLHLHRKQWRKMRLHKEYFKHKSKLMKFHFRETLSGADKREQGGGMSSKPHEQEFQRQNQDQVKIQSHIGHSILISGRKNLSSVLRDVGQKQTESIKLLKQTQPEENLAAIEGSDAGAGTKEVDKMRGENLVVKRPSNEQLQRNTKVHGQSPRVQQISTNRNSSLQLEQSTMPGGQGRFQGQEDNAKLQLVDNQNSGMELDQREDKQPQKQRQGMVLLENTTKNQEMMKEGANVPKLEQSRMQSSLQEIGNSVNETQTSELIDGDKQVQPIHSELQKLPVKVEQNTSQSEEMAAKVNHQSWESPQTALLEKGELTKLKQVMQNINMGEQERFNRTTQNKRPSNTNQTISFSSNQKSIENQQLSHVQQQNNHAKDKENQLVAQSLIYGKPRKTLDAHAQRAPLNLRQENINKALTRPNQVGVLGSQQKKVSQEFQYGKQIAGKQENENSVQQNQGTSIIPGSEMQQEKGLGNSVQQKNLAQTEKIKNMKQEQVISKPLRQGEENTPERVQKIGREGELIVLGKPHIGQAEQIKQEPGISPEFLPGLHSMPPTSSNTILLANTRRKQKQNETKIFKEQRVDGADNEGDVGQQIEKQWTNITQETMTQPLPDQNVEAKLKLLQGNTQLQTLQRGHGLVKMQNKIQEQMGLENATSAGSFEQPDNIAGETWNISNKHSAEIQGVSQVGKNQNDSTRNNVTYEKLPEPVVEQTPEIDKANLQGLKEEKNEMNLKEQGMSNKQIGSIVLQGVEEKGNQQQILEGHQMNATSTMDKFPNKEIQGNEGTGNQQQQMVEGRQRNATTTVDRIPNKEKMGIGGIGNHQQQMEEDHQSNANIAGDNIPNKESMQEVNGTGSQLQPMTKGHQSNSIITGDKIPKQSMRGVERTGDHQQQMTEGHQSNATITANKIPNNEMQGAGGIGNQHQQMGEEQQLNAKIEGDKMPNKEMQKVKGTGSQQQQMTEDHHPSYATITGDKVLNKEGQGVEETGGQQQQMTEGHHPSYATITGDKVLNKEGQGVEETGSQQQQMTQGHPSYATITGDKVLNKEVQGVEETGSQQQQMTEGHPSYATITGNKEIQGIEGTLNEEQEMTGEQELNATVEGGTLLKQKLESRFMKNRHEQQKNILEQEENPISGNKQTLSQGNVEGTNYPKIITGVQTETVNPGNNFYGRPVTLNITNVPANQNKGLFATTNSTLNLLINDSRKSFRSLPMSLVAQRVTQPKGTDFLQFIRNYQEQVGRNESLQKDVLQNNKEGKEYSLLEDQKQHTISHDPQTNLVLKNIQSIRRRKKFQNAQQEQSIDVEGRNEAENRYPVVNLQLKGLKPSGQFNGQAFFNNSISITGQNNSELAYKLKQKSRNEDTLDQNHKAKSSSALAIKDMQKRRRNCKRGWCTQQGGEWNYETGSNNVQTGGNLGTGVSNPQGGWSYGAEVPNKQGEWNYVAGSSNSDNGWNYGTGSSTVSTTTTSTTTSNSQSGWGCGSSSAREGPNYGTGLSNSQEGCNYGTGVSTLQSGVNPGAGGSSLQSGSYQSTTGVAISQAASNHLPGESNSQVGGGGCNKTSVSESTGGGGSSHGAGTETGESGGTGSIGGGSSSGGTENGSSSGGSMEESDAEFEKEALLAHNHFRYIHEAPPMLLNRQLSKDAKAYAEKIARVGSLTHSTQLERDNAGENLAMGCKSHGTPLTGKQAVTNWYNEVCKYNFDNPSFSKDTGHFTQVVWRDSVQLGIGKARGTWQGMPCIYAVGRYKVMGNFNNQYKKEVLKGTFDPSYCKNINGVISDRK